METLIERVAALDVHKDSLLACVRVPGEQRSRQQEKRRFATTTAGLLVLRDWLRSYGVTVVGMESTGCYWKPVYYLLEHEFECWLLNAQHLRNVPGRKTDMNDAEWICQLLEHGLVRASFVPPRPIRELRDLTRYRRAQIEERTREAQRLDKVLQDAGIKLSSVASDVLGVSGRAMLAALLGGTHDPELLAELARGKLRQKLPALREALAGRFRAHHALIVGQILAHIDFLDETIVVLSAQIEIGPDMSIFPSHRHLASWAGLCPGNNESGGKRKSGRTRKGSKWLHAALTQSAKAASRSKGTYLSGQYARLKGRRGHAKATVATAHSILVSAYYMLERGVPYQELGELYFQQRQQEHVDRYRRRLVRQLERLGHAVTLEPLAEVA